MTLSKKSNRVETFDDKYGKIVEEMNDYLRDHGLNMISWTYENGNRFKISLSKKFFSSNIRGKKVE